MIGLDHFVWFPVEGSGYQENASGSSKKINPEHFKSWFKEFLPVILSHREDEAYLIFNKSQSPFLLLTRFGYTEDEIGRDAPMHHSAVVHKKLLEKEKLSLFDVRDSLRQFDEEYQKVEGELERLKVPEKEGQDFAFKDEIKTLLTPAAVKSLSYRLLKSKKNRVILRCEGSNETERFKIAAYLVKLLSVDFDIRATSITTIRPRDKYCNLFDVAVTEKTFTPPRHTESWSYVEWDLDEFKKGKPKHKELKKVFERIEEDFIYDIAEYLEDNDSQGEKSSEDEQEIQKDQKKTKKVDDVTLESEEREEKSKEVKKKIGPIKEEEIKQKSDSIEDFEDEKEKARFLLKEAEKEYDSIDFDELEEFIDSSNFDFEIFKVKLENLKEKGEKITKEIRKEKALEKLEKAEEKEIILHEDYLDINKSIEKEENLSLFEERLEKAKKRKRLHLLIEEICKGFEMPEDIREKLVRQGKKNIEISSGELSSDEIREELEEIKGKMESYYQSLDESEEKDKINNVEDLVLDYCPVDFGDVAGMSELKERLSMAVESPIEDYEVILESTGSPPENSGILLYGAPGVGKTFMARAVAGEYQLEYGLDVVDVPMETIYGLHWSKQVERIVDIFKLSEERSPAMVIWDEFDSYAADPKLTGRKYDEKKTTTFKQKFEGMTESDNKILHIATSNYPWKLELPLIRPGRLGEIIFVPPPDKRARKEILKLLASDAKMEGIDFEKLAEVTKDATIANLKNIVKEATQRPVREWREEGRKGKPRSCTMDDFLWAVDKENLSQYESWVKEAKRELERPKLQSKADLFPEIAEEYERVVD